MIAGFQAANPDIAVSYSDLLTSDIYDRIVAETVTRVLYPDDSTVAGQSLRFTQEYFLVCCSLADIVARFRRTNDDWRLLPDKAAVRDKHQPLERGGRLSVKTYLTGGETLASGPRIGSNTRADPAVDGRKLQKNACGSTRACR